MAKQDDGLFLLEVLIDKIIFVKSPCFSDRDFRTCVTIQCPAMETLEICDDDPGAGIAKSSGPFVKTFNSGKSCLFSLKEADIQKAMSKYPIKISVYKSLPCGCLPTKIMMGEATIDMTKEFVQARKKFLEDPTGVSYEALKDSFRIVGPDNSETGEVVMFLRISCFGKLIITRFQGSAGPPKLATGGGGPVIVDRSCNPKKNFQTTQDPCACGAALVKTGAESGPASRRQQSGFATYPIACYHAETGGAGGTPSKDNVGKGGGACPIARDPYDSRPCEDPDDLCYCSGPKPARKPQMDCRNTDQYCLHLPKGSMPGLPLYQDIKEDQRLEILEPDVFNSKQSMLDDNDFIVQRFTTKTIIKEYLQILVNHRDFPAVYYANTMSNALSNNSLSTIRSKRRSVTFSESINSFSRTSTSSQDSYYTATESWSKYDSLFGNKETTVYMTLFDEFCYIRHSGTQATASLNKSLQVNDNTRPATGHLCKNFQNNLSSTSTMYNNYPETISRKGIIKNTRPSEVYFFGRKKVEPKSSKSKLSRSGSKSKVSGVGSSKSKPKQKVTAAPALTKKESSSTQARAIKQSSSSQTNKRGMSSSTSTGRGSKSVMIKDKSPCPATSGTKGDLTATVSKICIGPRELCPFHGSSPCQGPKCIIASSGEDQQEAPVKVTTVTNPRRGVFELVVRRMNGAPLAKNELMLEWTPPPSRPACSAGPCVVPCGPVPCRFPRCKMIVCRPLTCKPKCKKPCKKPCGPLTCKRCCGKPCSPCPPLSCCPRPCPPSPCPGRASCGVPCAQPCGGPPCSMPCNSSPCLRLCPVGRRRPRRCRSQPRIRAHKKRISPCCNRSFTCPVVRCQSVPSPCFGPPCCGPMPCPPRKCSSQFPFKPPNCCKSVCSSCCG